MIPRVAHTSILTCGILMKRLPYVVMFPVSPLSNTATQGSPGGKSAKGAPLLQNGRRGQPNKDPTDQSTPSFAQLSKL